MDFQKAFDKVPHERLISKVKAVGIEGKVLHWIREWLRERKQRVVLDGENSEWKEVKSGVPQGSVLGPVLFLIYINDIDENIANMTLKFADDIKLIGKVKTLQDIESMKRDVKILVEWSEKWLMPYNIEKCKVMHLGNNNTEVRYEIKGLNLQVINEETDLGVIVTKNFKWDSQCRKAASKGNQILGMIARTFTCRNQKLLMKL
jgi:hypothetical protein